MSELIKAGQQETVLPLEEFLHVKSFIYLFTRALEFWHAIVNFIEQLVCVSSPLPPPDANARVLLWSG